MRQKSEEDDGITENMKGLVREGIRVCVRISRDAQGDFITPLIKTGRL